MPDLPVNRLVGCQLLPALRAASILRFSILEAVLDIEYRILKQLDWLA